MIPAERRARIVDLVKERRAVRVSSLSEDLGVSGMTIRRDLERLEAEGVLVRTHGGAVLKRHMAEETLYVERESASAEEKRRIAAAAAALIEPGETVFLSSGTTAAQVIRHIDPALEARIVTHNVGAVQEARGLRVEVVLAGGLYRPRSNAVSGPLAIEHIARFHAGKMLIGVDGFDLEEGLTTPTMSMASVERAMIAADARRGHRARRQLQDRRGRRRRRVSPRPGGPGDGRRRRRAGRARRDRASGAALRGRLTTRARINAG